MNEFHVDVSVVSCREGNDPEDCTKMTYKQVLEETCKFANVLKSKGRVKTLSFFNSLHGASALTRVAGKQVCNVRPGQFDELTEIVFCHS